MLVGTGIHAPLEQRVNILYIYIYIYVAREDVLVELDVSTVMPRI